jgi:hypothetical protein
MRSLYVRVLLAVLILLAIHLWTVLSATFPTGFTNAAIKKSNNITRDQIMNSTHDDKDFMKAMATAALLQRLA